MSDQPEAEPNPVSPAILRDTRWIAAIIWVAVLAALVFTSAQGIESITQGSIASNYLRLASGFPDTPDDLDRLALVALGLAGFGCNPSGGCLAQLRAGDQGDPLGLRLPGRNAGRGAGAR